MNTVLVDARIKKLLLAFLLFSGIYLVFAFLPKDANAVNQAGWGWSIPVGRTNDPSCFPTTANRTWVKILLVDSVTKAAVNANIRIEDPGGAISAQGFGSFLEMPCAVTNRGVWVSVWGASGYRTWDLSTNFNGRSQNYNWCCGYQFLDAAADDGKTVTFQILLVPNSISIPTITANFPIGTSLVDPGRTIIPSAGGTTPVNFNITTGSMCPCPSGSQIINRYLWVRNVDTGVTVINSNVDNFAGNIGYGANSIYPANLPNGRYQWYMQIEENRRGYVFIPNTLPISAQFPWQYFEIVALQPNLRATVSAPGGITVGQNVTFSGSVVNNGNANTAGPFFVRFCLDPGSPCYGNASNVYGPTTSFVGPLNVGASLNSTSTTWTATAGSHTIWYCADVNGPPGSIPESNEAQGDNCGSLTFNVSAPRPDLTSSITPFAVPAVGQVVTFNATTRNTGTVATGAQFFVRFCLDPISVCYGNVPPLNLGPVASFIGPINAGGSVGSTSTNWTATPGPHTIWFCADVNGPPGAIAESNENNNCSSVAFNVSAPRPDLVITAPNVTNGTVLVPQTIRASVTNSGTGPTQFTSLSRLRIDIGRNGSYEYTITSPPNSTPPGIAAGATDPVTKTWSWTPGAGDSGNARAEICSDYTNAEPEIFDGNNCVTVDFVVDANNSWMKTNDGDVGSQGNIDDLDKASGQTAAEYLVIANYGNTISTGLSTVKNWLIPPPPSSSPYSLTLPAPNNYQRLLDKFAGAVGGQAPTGSLPSAPGIYRYDAGFTWNGSGGGCTYDPNDNGANPDGIVVFVNGSITIGNGGQSSLNLGCPTVIIASGSIIVNSNITSINAFLVSTGMFRSQPPAAANPVSALTINGGVISSLNGVSIGPQFTRQLSDNSSPAEVINYKPEYLWLLKDLLGSSSSSFAETNP